MRPRLLRSLAYRSAFAYRGLAKLLPRTAPPPKPGIDCVYLTFGGSAHADMLCESVLSVARSWPRVPRLRVVSDGTLDLVSLRKRLHFWPGALESCDWRDLAPATDAGTADTLRRFAEREPMGRKLTAILGTAQAGPTLYCDVDFLWFRYPRSLDGLLLREPPTLAMSRDMVPAYDAALLEGPLRGLADAPYFCAGTLFANGDLLRAMDVSSLLDHAARSGTGITEQTILAAIGRHLGDALLPPEEIALLDEDRFSLGPSFRGRGWAGRHYVGQVRHLFWRDALALRIGLRP
jgi:hypothetical protein